MHVFSPLFKCVFYGEIRNQWLWLFYDVQHGRKHFYGTSQGLRQITKVVRKIVWENWVKNHQASEVQFQGNLIAISFTKFHSVWLQSLPKSYPTKCLNFMPHISNFHPFHIIHVDKLITLSSFGPKINFFLLPIHSSHFPHVHILLRCVFPKNEAAKSNNPKIILTIWFLSLG